MELRDLYVDVRDVAEKAGRSAGYGMGRLRATFSGVIPESTRSKIKAAQKDFSQIYIIAEAHMSYEGMKLPIGDPIVAGWCGEQLWYIDDFDTSPVEEAALLVGPNNP